MITFEFNYIILNYLDLRTCKNDDKICSNLRNSYCVNNNVSLTHNYECKCYHGFEKKNGICKGYYISTLFILYITF